MRETDRGRKKNQKIPCFRKRGNEKKDTLFFGYVEIPDAISP
jgi:hypothetical protein